MRAIAVAIATIALTGCATDSPEVATSALAGEDEIRPVCEERWEDNWARIALCVEQQTEGFREALGK